MATDTTSTGRDSDKVMVRMPDGMRDALKTSAMASNRTMNAEIVSRLQDSFDKVGVEQGDLQRLEGEAAQQRMLAESLRHLGDMGDALRSVVAAMALKAIEHAPETARKAMLTEGLSEQLAGWLEKQDPRGAAFSLIELLDGSSPQVIEDLRNFASHLEDLGLYRKRITLTVRGKRTETDVYANSPKSTTATAGRGSVNKVIVVGNLGRDPEARTFPAHLEIDGVTIGGHQVPKSATPRGPVKSPNARKRPPK